MTPGYTGGMIAFLSGDRRVIETLVSGMAGVSVQAAGSHTAVLQDGAGALPELPEGVHLSLVMDPEKMSGLHGLVDQFFREKSSLGEDHLVAFQGARGAYSEQAIYQFFGPCQVLPCSQFRDTFEAVRQGSARYGVLPIENALTGSIHDNYDLLKEYPDLVICGETRLRIRHHLYGIPGARLEDIRRVFSHPQGLLQCGAFLSSHPDWVQAPFYDTAGSVAHIADLASAENAAIAGAAAKVYGMPVLAEGIETNHQNYTRFMVLARRDDACFPLDLESRELKASLLFTLPHQPGALLRAMTIMGSRALNLSRIESRPIHGKPWEYLFHLDLEIGNDVAGFLLAMEELSRETEEARVLGIYPGSR